MKKFLLVVLTWLTGIISVPLAFWLYRDYPHTREHVGEVQWWRVRAAVDTFYFTVPRRTSPRFSQYETIRLSMVYWRLDRLSAWRWQVPLGRGPRWLRRCWCLAFHWRHFTQISDTTAGKVGQMQEHIVIRGCYTCQLPWWHTQTMVEDDDGDSSLRSA